MAGERCAAGPAPSSACATTSMLVLAQQRDEPLAQQRLVLGDHDPHGSSARIVVPPPAGLVDGQRAVERLDAVAQPGQPAAARVRAARAVVGDLDEQARRRRASSVTARRRARRVLGRVGQRLGDDEVGGASRPPARAGASSSTSTSTGTAERARRAPRRPRPGRGRRAPAARSRGRGRAARRSRRWPRRARWRTSSATSGWSASRSSARPSCMLSATSRACAPSCRSRSIRRSSAACTSSAPRRVRVSVSTRSVSSARGRGRAGSQIAAGRASARMVAGPEQRDRGQNAAAAGEPPQHHELAGHRPP